MTRQTELYLLNYLQKKSMTMAASQEVIEASSLCYRRETFRQATNPEWEKLRSLREAHAVAIVEKYRLDEAAAFDAYMSHLQEVSGAGP